MAYEFKLPDLGEGVVEGEIVKWLVSEGDTIDEDQALLEIMTDKATVKIPSPKGGKVTALNGREGDVVAVGDVLVVIDTGDGKAAPSTSKKNTGKRTEKARVPAAAAAASARRTETPPARLKGGLPARTTSALAGRIPPATATRAAPAGRMLASPSVRRKARELGIDLATVTGSGDSGRITAADLTNAARGNGVAMQAQAPAAAARTVDGPPYNLPPGVAPPPPGGESRIPLKGIRKAIANHMQRSKSHAAHFTFVEEVDMRKLMRLRAELKPVAAAQGVKLNYLPFFVKAVVKALQRHPQLNVTLDEEAGEIVYRGYYNIGIAAATDEGLIVPVVKNADERSLLDLSREISRLADAARHGGISLDDIKGSTFTITSLGRRGGHFATPIINYPEVAILGIHEIKEKPIVEDGEIKIGNVMLMSLSFDHRLVDGHVGAAFAHEIVDILENPERLLLEMV